jgi:2-phospho-L-lactate guanylyltransferase (CobY/MobA/RfbA family)
MQDLRIAIVQADLVWESPLANREQLDRMLEGIGDCDLVVCYGF